jgi:hypothetical protein
MKEEVRKALEQLNDYADRYRRRVVRLDMQDDFKIDIENQVATIERALNDTTLERKPKYKVLYDDGMKVDMAKDIFNLVKVLRNTIDINSDEQVMATIDNQLDQECYTLLNGIIYTPIEDDTTLEIVKRKREELLARKKDLAYERITTPSFEQRTFLYNQELIAVHQSDILNEIINEAEASK